MDLAAVEVVDRGDHADFLLPDEFSDDLAVRGQQLGLVHGIVLHGTGHGLVPVGRKVLAQMDFFEELAEISLGFVFTHGRGDSAALVVAEHDDQGNVKVLDRIVDRPQRERLADIAGHANHEDFTQPPVEDDLGGNT